MGCVICGQRNVDGALNENGEYVCLDCWVVGEASARGMIAVEAVPAKVSYPVYYPPDVTQRLLDACNGK